MLIKHMLPQLSDANQVRINAQKAGGDDVAKVMN